MSYLRACLSFCLLSSSVSSAFMMSSNDTFQRHLFRDKINYIVSWNSLSLATIDNFLMYYKEGKAKIYEVIRSFFNCSWMRVKWLNSMYGYSIHINCFDQMCSNYNLLSNKKGKRAIGVISGCGGLFVSYNNNGGLYKDTINIGGFMAFGLLWSRPYLFKKTNVLIKLKNCRNYFIFDIVWHISPVYIQFKDWFFISINYKLGIIDLIYTLTKNEQGGLIHLLDGIAINLGIF